VKTRASVKDIVGVVVFLMIFSAVGFFAPAMNGYFFEHANFIEAHPLKTPEHIAPLKIGHSENSC
jgi:ubiquinol-cytochrome c reductase cytochrome b subunit